MTNELEKQFFDKFGIEPKIIIEPRYSLNTEYYEKKIEKYPQITDRILLELLFILTTLLGTTVYEDVFITVAKNREELKKDIFQECMLYKQHIKQQVRTLFEGDTNDR